MVVLVDVEFGIEFEFGFGLSGDIFGIEEGGVGKENDGEDIPLRETRGGVLWLLLLLM